MCYYFDSIIKIEEFDFNNNLKDESSYENIFIYNISYTTLIGAKPFRIRFHKVNRFIRIYMGLYTQYYLGLKNMMPYTIGLYVL